MHMIPFTRYTGGIIQLRWTHCISLMWNLFSFLCTKNDSGNLIFYWVVHKITGGRFHQDTAQLVIIMMMIMIQILPFSIRLVTITIRPLCCCQTTRHMSWIVHLLQPAVSHKQQPTHYHDDRINKPPLPSIITQIQPEQLLQQQQLLLLLLLLVGGVAQWLAAFITWTKLTHVRTG